MSSTTIRLEGTLTPEQTLTYVHLPFDVPENTERIDVVYRYDAAISSDPTLRGGNTIDIGIFDPRGTDFNSQGYRGWSGSARDRFTIGRDTATPGYMPGLIQAGTWYICLGAYKVADAACHYQVEITWTAAQSDSTVEFPPLLRLSDEPGKRYNDSGWYRGDLHCHTVNSDGDSTPEEIVRLAEILGLDFLAVTDHNNRSQGIDLANIETDLLLIPGYEVTTYHGHWNIWGDGDWIDFRVLTEADMSRAVAAANEAGYLVSLNHPRPYGPEWDFPNVEGNQCVEVWNGPWHLMNNVALEFWETRLRQGKRLVAVGGSDHHITHRGHHARLGTPTTFIYCERKPSPTAILRSLREGHAFISESPTGAQIYLTTDGGMMGDTVPRPQNNQLPVEVRVIDGNGATLELHGAQGLLNRIPINGSDQQIALTLSVEATGYVRAQVVDSSSNEVRALTNPIYLSGVSH